MTARIIELHDKGYECDYRTVDIKNLICLQTGYVFSISETLVYIADIEYDQLTKSFKYIHVVDPGNGEKGILIANSPCCCTVMNSEVGNTKYSSMSA